MSLNDKLIMIALLTIALAAGLDWIERKGNHRDSRTSRKTPE